MSQNPHYQAAIDSVNTHKIGLKSPLMTPVGKGFRSLNLALRKEFSLYANVRPCKSIEGFKTLYDDVDVVTIRENTEGEYSGIEHEIVDGVVQSIKLITENASRRVADYAFKYAEENGRQKVTAVHKANIMRMSDGLFLKCCREEAEKHPGIKFEERYLDTVCLNMVQDPAQYDVLVMPNLYGNILVNIAAGLVGGAGLVAGEGYSEDCAVFEPGARHSYNEVAGKNVANPAAMLLTSANLLDHARLGGHADTIRKAVYGVLGEGKVKTKDLGGHAGTRQFTAAVVQKLGRV